MKHVVVAFVFSFGCLIFLTGISAGGCESRKSTTVVTGSSSEPQIQSDARKAHLEAQAKIEKERKVQAERDRRENRPIQDVR